MQKEKKGSETDKINICRIVKAAFDNSIQLRELFYSKQYWSCYYSLQNNQNCLHLQLQHNTHLIVYNQKLKLSL